MTHEIRTRLFDREVQFGLSGPWLAYWAVFLRLVVGWWFFYAGLHKFAFLAGEPFDASGWLVGGTQSAPAWIHGFLAWAGTTPWLLEITNVAIPVGQVLIGLGVMAGALTRLAAFFGAFLTFFFYFGNADWANGFVNGELFGLLLFLTLIVLGAGRVYGVDALLERTAVVRNNRWLRYLLG